MVSQHKTIAKKLVGQPHTGKGWEMDSEALVWKLLDKRCAQLTDAIAAARTPFLLALTWSLLWFWVLYTFEFGYAKTLFERYQTAYLLANNIATGQPVIPPHTFTPQKENNEVKPDKQEQNTADQKNQEKAPSANPKPDDKKNIDVQNTSNITDDAKKLLDFCERFGITKDKTEIELGNIKFKIDDPKKLAYCKETVVNRYNYYDQQLRDSRWISFPGGFSKVVITDLGIVGNAALLLILTWGFYAARRENHAILSFVDRSVADRNLNLLFPPEITLISKTSAFNGEHLSYAYHAVSQRFVFIFSTRSKPLLHMTIALIAFPAIISTWHFFTDMRDLLSGNYEISVFIRTIVEFGLLGAILFITAFTIRFMIDTSVLLNAWYLAEKDVWSLNENRNKTGSDLDVAINIVMQRAKGPT